MTLDNILTIIKDIIDICLVWAGLYFVLKSIKTMLNLQCFLKV